MIRLWRSLSVRARLLLLSLVVLAPLAMGCWLWLRDSSLVAVKKVSVTVAAGPDSQRIRSALNAAARGMSTLDVRMNRLRRAVAPFAVVKDLHVSTQFPHGIRIRVIEQIPVAALVFEGRRIAVAADNTLLHDVVASPSLPVVNLRTAPHGSRVLQPDARSEIAVLGTAPWPLLGKVSQVTTTGSHGLVATLRSGPSIYFGDASRLYAKWIAASEVLGDPGSVGAAYIDVSDPERPAAGAGSGEAVVSASSGPAQQGTSSGASGASQQLAPAVGQLSATGPTGARGSLPGTAAGVQQTSPPAASATQPSGADPALAGPAGVRAGG